jgi:hypothetical protein
MWQLFGSYSEYKKAPKKIALRQKLRLIAKWEAEKEIAEDAERKSREGR